MAKPAIPWFGGRELASLSSDSTTKKSDKASVGSAPKSFNHKILGIKCLGVSRMWPLRRVLPKVLSEKNGRI